MAAGYDVLTPSRTDPISRGSHLGHVIYSIGLTADFRTRPFDTVRAHVSVLSDVIERGRFDSLLYLSSTRVYGKSREAVETAQLSVDVADPSDLYNLSKLMGESICLNGGREGVRIVRLSNVYGGDFQSENFLAALIHDAIEQRRIELRTAPESSKDYVSIRDVVGILPSIAARGRERIYNVASGINVANGQLVNRLAELTGCAVVVAQNAPAVIFPTINYCENSTRVRLPGVFGPG